MELVGWIALGLYLTTVPFAWRMAAGHIAWSWSKTWHQEEPDAADLLGATFLGLLIAPIWPLVLAAPTLWRVGEWTVRLMPTIGAEAEHRRKLACKRAQANRNRDLREIGR